MNLRATHPDQEEHAQPAATKFMYASGARPLAGYTIKRGVGHGGFGEVYFATSDAGKEVALKLIRRNLDVELRGVRQCLNLKHQNLVALYDIRTDDTDDQWVVMEYVSGKSLEEVIDQHPEGMPIDKVLWWMRGVGAGVAYLHDHGIVHRDLKPGNLFLDDDTIKIGDYGLAKFISCSRRSGQTESVGTVHYMAPEIANGRYGREIDTYALGIILFEMLTGHVPFQGESVGEVLMKHMTAEPDLTQLDEPYRTIVGRALAKDPDVRISSVGELISLLPAPPQSTDPAAPFTAPQADFSQPTAAAEVAQPTSTPVSKYEEEPLQRFVRDKVDSVTDWFHNWDVSPFKRGAAIFLAIFVLISSGGAILPMIVPLLVCYGIYYVVWITLIRPGVRHHAGQHIAGQHRANEPRGAVLDSGILVPDTDPPATRLANSRLGRRRTPRPHWRDLANATLVAEPIRDKLSSMFGSLMLSAAVAAIVAAAASLFIDAPAIPSQLAYILWLTLVGTLGSWAIIISNKFTEGHVEDQVPMRATLLVLGAGLGATAWLLSSLLLVSMPYSESVGPLPENSLAADWFDISTSTSFEHTGQNFVRPDLGVFVVYFACLLLLLRWWRQAEFTRSSRLSLWNVSVCVFWAWLLHYFWWFPQPTGMIVAGTIAFATQLASPWLPPSQRRALKAEIASDPNIA